MPAVEIPKPKPADSKRFKIAVVPLKRFEAFFFRNAKRAGCCCLIGAQPHTEGQIIGRLGAFLFWVKNWEVWPQKNQKLHDDIV